MDNDLENFFDSNEIFNEPLEKGSSYQSILKSAIIMLQEAKDNAPENARQDLAYAIILSLEALHKEKKEEKLKKDLHFFFN